MPELKPTIDDAMNSALKLKELDKSIITAFVESDWNKLIECVEKFNLNKKVIKIYLIPTKIGTADGQ